MIIGPRTHQNTTQFGDRTWNRSINEATYRFYYGPITASLITPAAWIHVTRNGQHIHSFIVTTEGMV